MVSSSGSSVKAACGGTKKDGGPCKSPAKAGTGFCGRHTPETVPTDLKTVVGGGDRLQSLKALRDRLAVQIDQCDSGRDVASLSARLVEVLDKIATAEDAEPKDRGTALDEFSRRRQARTASNG